MKKGDLGKKQKKPKNRNGHAFCNGTINSKQIKKSQYKIQQVNCVLGYLVFENNIIGLHYFCARFVIPYNESVRRKSGRLWNQSLAVVSVSMGKGFMKKS